MEGAITQLGLSNYLIDKNKKGKSYFQHSYHSYKNFAAHSKIIPFDNSFRYNDTSSIRLDNYGNYGDLITNIYVEITLPTLSTTGTGASTGWCNGVGNAILKEITLRIGNDIYARTTSEFMDIWGELTTSVNSLSTYKQMVRKYSAHNYDTFKGGKVTVPLQFWFCRSLSEKYDKDRSLIFPLTSLVSGQSRNEIKLEFKVRSFSDLTISEDDTIPSELAITDANIIVDYIVLDKNERRDFQPSPDHKFISNHIMTQVQLFEEDISAGTLQKNINLRELKYPVTELIWVIRTNIAENANQYFNYGDSLNTINNNPINKIEFKIEGRSRMTELSAEHYSQIELSKRHTNNPNNYVHIYSFALEPENFAQPSGICNFSEIQESQLILKFNTGILASKFYLFAINYNVMTITDKGNVSLLHNLSGSVPGTI